MNRGDARPILKAVFGRRLEILEAIHHALEKDDVSALKCAADALRKAAATIGTGPAADGYRLYSTLATVGAHLISWTKGVKVAEPDSGRHLRAAKENAQNLLADWPSGRFWRPHREIAESVAGIAETSQTKAYLQRIQSLPLPVPLLSHSKPDSLRRRREAADIVAAPDSEIFLEFVMDGKPFADPETVSPGELHDIALTVSVKNWPKDAEHLWVHPVSVEPTGIYNLPEFKIAKPASGAPARWKLDGRLNINVRQQISARPLAFSYRADFLPDSGKRRSVVSGNRMLSIRSHDPALNPISGYPEVDKKLIDLRDTVRSTVNVEDHELTAFLTVMTTLGRTAAKALQDADFPGVWDESAFQKRIRDVLRVEPRIGGKLEEHPRAGGGITDLSFERVRVELKAEDRKFVTLDGALQYVGQTTQYVAGTSKRLGVLCILDTSPKAGAPGSVANDIGLFQVQPPGGEGGIPISIGIVIVRGNLPRPSDLSHPAASIPPA